MVAWRPAASPSRSRGTVLITALALGTVKSPSQTPISSMPPALQAFTAINPLRYAIDMSVRVYLEGVGVGRLMPDLWPLALIAVGSLTGAAWVFERRLV